jgi:adenosylcobyric acid synthase
MTDTARAHATSLAILGTASEVGKSVVAAALCRIFSDAGFSVAPFKAQNMSNNSYVTLQGDEMGRAQVVQAQAARVEPHVDMNPVLLKPGGDNRSQVVLMGHPLGDREAKAYYAEADGLFSRARESLERLRAAHDIVIIEGAGSCAEVNLRDRDFVNFKTARAAEAPVVLVADIDRGGVFAQIVGTLEVLPEEDREMVKGLIINRFRGDRSLFDDGVSYLEGRTGLPVVGVVPYFHDILIDGEDAVSLDAITDPASGPSSEKINIAVIRLPHISNTTDFLVFADEPLVNLHYLKHVRALDDYDLVLLPGTKNVRRDLEWLRASGWDEPLMAHVEEGGCLGGICGGFQILGRVVRDPEGVDGSPGESEGLGLLDVETTMAPGKRLHRSSGTWMASDEPVTGYEIHAGVTSRGPDAEAACTVKTRDGEPCDEQEGAAGHGDRVWGTYLHGLFDTPEMRYHFLAELRPDLLDRMDEARTSARQEKDMQYDLLAAHFRQHVDIDALREMMGLQRPSTGE